MMVQTWHDLLFAHWPLEEQVLGPLVPHDLPLDTFEGRCWVGVVPFHMSGIRLRGLPALPGLVRFPELNVRTYVTLDGKPGVYFFSLDAASLPAVWAARALYRLPYFHARMSVGHSDSQIEYESHRREGNAAFRGRYRPTSEVRMRERGSLEHWLTERYSLYTVAAGTHHQPWPLQDEAAEIEVNTMASAAGISVPLAPPLLHFAKRLDVLIWLLRRVG
jgi:uncharacterized protein YqjF (DUF2071 family)